MRKILLATTALISLAASGNVYAAASAPLTVNVGGTTDFVAGTFSSQNHAIPGSSNTRDFESLYNLNFDVDGKTGNGIEYGGNLLLSNAPDASNAFEGASNGVNVDSAYVHMSGAFGKIQLGDSHGATDLVVSGAPTVGEGQVTGRYIDFLDTQTFAKNFALGIDGTDHSTNVTYFTPKVGNEDNKVQVGVSYVPEMYNYGGNVVKYNSGGDAVANLNSNSPYRDVVKGAVEYTGNIDPVALKASAHVITGNSDQTGGNNFFTGYAPANNVQNFTAFGAGAQGALDGFTLGLSYLNEGRYDTVVGQGKTQDQFTAGLKYEFSKFGLGVSYLGGKGYANTLSNAGTGVASTTNYVKDFSSYGAGGTYTWAPGLTSNLDGVYFNQETDAPGIDNKGYVLLVSQKLAF
jgi:hypothetical protein